MKTISMMTATALAAMLATGCKSSQNIPQISALEGDWNITSVQGKAATAEKDVYIGFDLQKNRMYGCAGCNRIMGTVNADTTKAGQLSFGAVGSTRMLCNDMTTEKAVLEALNNVSGYKGTEQALDLTDSKGNTLLTLTRRPAATLASLEGEWNITAVYGTPIEEIESTEKKPFLTFDANGKKVHGNAGCNIVNGGLTTDEDKKGSLQFGQLISTMMAGPGMTLERQVLDAMNKVTGFIVKNENAAVLIDENGEEALTLTRK